MIHSITPTRSLLLQRGSSGLARARAIATGASVRPVHQLSLQRPSITQSSVCGDRSNVKITNSVTFSSRTLQSRFMSASSPVRQEEESQDREMDSGEQDIHDILVREFKPRQLHVQDVSGGCGSFYSIVIASSKFKGVPTVKAHRLVNDALKDIIKGIHGLQLRTMAADE